MLAYFQVKTVNYMEPENITTTSKFILLGLSKENDIQPILFALFLFIYLVCIIGNMLIILIISSDAHLHTPMYFFLSNLSFTDICFISTTVPKMLVNIQAQNISITYEGCLTQMYFFMCFSGLDSLLLTVMAYDRFVAICHPLHYNIIMNPNLCAFLLLASVLASLVDSQVHNLIVLQFTYFNDMEISNFFVSLHNFLM